MTLKYNLHQLEYNFILFMIRKQLCKDNSYRILYLKRYFDIFPLLSFECREYME